MLIIQHNLIKTRTRERTFYLPIFHIENNMRRKKDLKGI